VKKLQKIFFCSFPSPCCWLKFYWKHTLKTILSQQKWLFLVKGCPNVTISAFENNSPYWKVKVWAKNGVSSQRSNRTKPTGLGLSLWDLVSLIAVAGTVFYTKPAELLISVRSTCNDITCGLYTLINVDTTYVFNYSQFN
jgi:hypothetical protein